MAEGRLERARHLREGCRHPLCADSQKPEEGSCRDTKLHHCLTSLLSQGIVFPWEKRWPSACDEADKIEGDLETSALGHAGYDHGIHEGLIC